jgi:hypothetical protein
MNEKSGMALRNSESFGQLSWQIPAFFQLDFVFCVQRGVIGDFSTDY